MNSSNGGLPALPDPVNPQPQYLTGSIRFETAFLALLGASFLFRLSYSSWVPLTGDELMHWQWSRHLDIGYPEHPPLIAWLIALIAALLGTAEWTVRLISVLAVSGTFWLAFRLGRELFGERAAFFGVVPLMITLLYNAGGTLANTDGLLAFFWTLTVLGVKRAVLDGKRWAWLWVGATIGLCLLSKLPGVFLFVALGLVLALTPEGRRQARRWEPYAAALLALLFFSPVIIWNVQHDWFTISMRVGHQAARGFTLIHFGELVAAQLLTLGPILFFWVVWGMLKSLRHRVDTRAALLGIFMGVPFLFYLSYTLFAKAGIHWPGVAYVTGFIAAGAFTAASSRRWMGGRSLALACIPTILLTALLYALPVAPKIAPESFAYQARPDKISTEQLLRNLIDWRELGTEIQHELDRADEDTFLRCRLSYGLAGLLAYYTPSQPDTFIWYVVERNGFSYDMWKAQVDLRGRDAVIVGADWQAHWWEELQCCFETISEPRVVEMRIGGQVIREFYVAHATGFKGFPPHRRMDGVKPD